MPALEIEVVPVLSDNYVYVLHEPSTQSTAIVDPPVAEPVRAVLEKRGWKADQILVTHHHGDHTAAVLELKAELGATVTGPEAEKSSIPGIDVALREGDTVRVGEVVGRVFETPGHTAGHISFWFPDAEALFCADTLFSLGCGRLFEGTAAQMLASLRKFDEMPDSTRVFCGHEYTQSNARFAVTVDPGNEALLKRAAEVDRLRAAGEPTIPSTLGSERAANPFLRVTDRALRSHIGMLDAEDAEVFAEVRRRKDAF